MQHFEQLQQDVCHKVPIDVCHKVPIDVCHKVPIDVCHKVPIDVCHKVPIDVCHKVPIDVHFTHLMNLAKQNSMSGTTVSVTPVSGHAFVKRLKMLQVVSAK